MRNLLLLAAVNAFFVFLNVLHAQTPNYLWTKSAIGTSFAESLDADATGNTYLTGGFSGPSISFGGLTLINASNGNQDIYIVKYDTNGNVIWAKSFGGTGSEIGHSIKVDENGNSYVTGKFTSPSLIFGATTLNNSGYENIFTIKLDSNGNILWAKSGTGSTSIATGIDIEVDQNGNSYVIGNFSSSMITFDNITLNNSFSGTMDMFIVKYDLNGNVIWAKREGGVENSSSVRLAIDDFGNSYVAGIFYDDEINFNGSTVINNGSNWSDVFVVKYDANGNVSWAKSFGGNYNDSVFGFDADSEGNTIISGHYQSSSINFGNNSINNSGINDMYIAKFDNNGNSIWANSISDGVSGGDLEIDVNGDFYITAPFGIDITFGNTTLTSNGGQSDLFLVKFSTDGNVYWAKSVGGNGWDVARAIAIDPNKNVYIAGFYDSPSVAFDGNSIYNSGSTYYMFVAKLDKTLPVQEHCDFTWSSSNMTVNFSMSNPNCTNFIWDFGNGNTSTINPNPIVTYATPGTYSACFQCNAPANCLSCATITVPSNSSGTTGIEETQNILGFSVYPNPSNNYITIENNNEQLNSTYIILNSIGQHVLSGQLIGELNTVDISELSNGIYLVQIETNSGRVSEKIIKN